MSTKKIVILDQYQVLASNLTKLKNALSITKQNIEDGCLSSDHWLDCDYLKTGQNQGRGQILFFEMEFKSVWYIITYDENLSAEHDTMLKRFFSSTYKDHYQPVEPSTWARWDEIQKGIAYRGGRGYAYGLHEYKG